jgi:hypothetical protein
MVTSLILVIYIFFETFGCLLLVKENYLASLIHHNNKKEENTSFKLHTFTRIVFSWYLLEFAVVHGSLWLLRGFGPFYLYICNILTYALYLLCIIMVCTQFPTEIT